MNNPFKLSPEDRLTAWFDFRQSIKNKTDQEKINAVAEYWAQCPFVGWIIDPEMPKEWPSVWEILFEGRYCMNTVAKCIADTLMLVDFEESRVALAMISENSHPDVEYMVVIIDNNHILNYSYGNSISINDVQKEISMKFMYQYKDGAYQINNFPKQQ